MNFYDANLITPFTARCFFLFSFYQIRCIYHRNLFSPKPLLCVLAFSASSLSLLTCGGFSTHQWLAGKAGIQSSLPNLTLRLLSQPRSIEATGKKSTLQRFAQGPSFFRTTTLGHPETLRILWRGRLGEGRFLVVRCLKPL